MNSEYRNEGYEAFYGGVTQDENPYDDLECMTLAAAEWTEGWTDALKETLEV